MSNDPRDTKSAGEFENDLEHIRSAWSRLEQAEPPDLLDQAVLNRARRELGTKPGRRPLRWLGALATAAVVVLALTIVIQQDRPLPSPALEGKDSFRLDSDTSAAVKKEAQVNAVEEQVARERAARQEIDELRDYRMKQSAPPAPASAAAAAGIMESNTPQIKMDEPELQAGEAVPEETAVMSRPQKAATELQAADLIEDVAVTPEQEAIVPGPEEWIERLLLLRDTQQDEKLVLELAAFREAYPDYPLPAELAD
jgi:hypothetical protein